MSKIEDSKFYHLMNETYIRNQDAIVKMLESIHAQNMLDIGCGGGLFTIRCAHAIGSNEVYGIEIDEQKTAEARTRGVNCFCGDASNRFSFDDEWFELIIANQVLEHVFDVDNMLSECRRILKKKGILILSTPNLGALYQKVLLLFGKQPTNLHVSKIQVGNFLTGVETAGHVHAFTVSALKDLLEYHKFKIEECKGCGFYPLTGFPREFLARLFPGFAVFQIIKSTKL